MQCGEPRRVRNLHNFTKMFTLPFKGKWRTIALNKCIGAKNNQYAEFSYPGPSRFIIALKLHHTTGKIGCAASAKTNWGCGPSHPMNIIITGKLIQNDQLEHFQG